MLQAHAVLRSDTVEGVVELGIADAYPGPLTHLHLDALQNQPVEGLTHQHVLGGKLRVFASHGLPHHGEAGSQFAGHDHVVFDDRHHRVEDLRLGLRRGDIDRQQQAGGEYESGRLRPFIVHCLCNLG